MVKDGGSGECTQYETGVETETKVNTCSVGEIKLEEQLSNPVEVLVMRDQYMLQELTHSAL